MHLYGTLIISYYNNQTIKSNVFKLLCRLWLFIFRYSVPALFQRLQFVIFYGFIFQRLQNDTRINSSSIIAAAGSQVTGQDAKVRSLANSFILGGSRLLVQHNPSICWHDVSLVMQFLVGCNGNASLTICEHCKNPFDSRSVYFSRSPTTSQALNLLCRLLYSMVDRWGAKLLMSDRKMRKEDKTRTTTVI